MKNATWSLFPMLVASLGGIATGEDQAGGRILAWEQGGTSLALQNHGKTVWCLVFDPAQPKSHFHPLASLDGRVMTAFEPDDHPWHRGLWWSWKFINGLNYWEENPKTRTSDGLTRLMRSNVVPAGDFSARAELEFHYHLPDQKPVLTEKRHLAISKPDAQGTYIIDWNSKFTAADQLVRLDRTVPAHLGGVAHGGYAGLSLRMAKGLDDFSFRTSEGETAPAAAHGKSARWVDLSGPAAGITILDHPGNPRHTPPWYLHSSKSMLFYSPSPLFNEPLEIAPGESLTLTYQIIIHSQPITPGGIEEQWRAFTQPQPADP